MGNVERWWKLQTDWLQEEKSLDIASCSSFHGEVILRRRAWVLVAKGLSPAAVAAEAESFGKQLLAGPLLRDADGRMLDMVIGSTRWSAEHHRVNPASLAPPFTAATHLSNAVSRRPRLVSKPPSKLGQAAVYLKDDIEAGDLCRRPPRF